jgi:hypothetical protein
MLWSPVVRSVFTKAHHFFPILSHTKRLYLLQFHRRSILLSSICAKFYVLRLSRQQNCMNCSRADSCVSCLKTSDVSETHSVSILRDNSPWGWRLSVSLKRRRFLNNYPWGWRLIVSLKRRRFLSNWHGCQSEKSLYYAKFFQVVSFLQISSPKLCTSHIPPSSSSLT